ncbi:uncharacterized protein LOC112514958 [Cynara cardunculus var. scolymus]|uniref:DUF7950 domain-containing protein n=1 Tax=Cynara cardunculus var. scolymus TaxID=59895 RepID=A0A103XY51_CYNCS|nr:uncharacterized protein LOC112514958 [Cynara cardunculus var. scolymus]KVH98989.1 hypothetical protein Ccrd_022786 [Cynara cardunculus var. scolymus]
MNGTGGCCIARYSGSGGAGVGVGGGEISYGISKVERIMLKFRPIAPKPMAAGSGSSCSTMENSEGYGGTRRCKRKYVRGKGKQTKKDANTTVSKKMKVSVPSSSSVSGGGDEVVTLSLLPDRKEKLPARSNSESENPDLLSPITFNLNNKQTVCYGHVQGAASHVVSVTDHAVVMMSPPPQVISVVTVECVTETWANGGGVGFTDEPAAMKMEMDTCPSFVTNSRDMVVWTNTAYREMTVGGGSDETVVVKKFNRVRMPVTLPAFTCKVKVTWGTESSSSPSSLTAPCDVWRLQNGGYAWRLDVKAALCLGR